MKKEFVIKIAGYLLLSIYLFGISPSLVIHQHQNDVVAYEHATVCEKASFYGETENDPHHKAHVSELLELCWLCDHHTIAPQILFESSIDIGIITEYTTFIACYSEQNVFAEAQVFYQRGPPLI